MVEHGAAGGARRDFLSAGDELSAGGGDCLLPIDRQFAIVTTFEFRTQVGRSRLDAVGPGGARSPALGADLAPLAQQRLRDHERRGIPTEDLTGAGDLFFARGVAMGFLGAGYGGESEADDGLAGDQRWF